MGFVPQFVDLNGDGRKDMISGSYMGDYQKVREEKGERAIVEYPEGGEASEVFAFFQQEDGSFSARVRIAYCHIHSVASPVDWDGDGDIDLITAHDYIAEETDRASMINLLENTGTKTEPRFSRPQPLLTGLTGVPNHIASSLAVDWDGDGDLDLLASAQGEDGSILLFERIPRQENGAVFKQPISLICESAMDSQTKEKWQDVFSITVTDFNGDGVHDVLAGTDWIQRLSEDEMLAGRSAEDTARYREAKAKTKEFEKRISELRPDGDYSEWSAEQQRNFNEQSNMLFENYTEYFNLLSGEFSTRIRHGYVWLFPGKKASQ